MTKPSKLNPPPPDVLAPEVAPLDVPEVAPLDVPSITAPGPVIEYIGEGADRVVFTINPKATKYVVRSDGQILESF